MSENVNDIKRPGDKQVNFEEAMNSLTKRGCLSKEINYMKTLLKGHEVYDYSGYSGDATILVVDSNPKFRNLCIKICDTPGGLLRNYIMLKFLSKHDVAPNIIRYINRNKDYLIMECVDSPMAFDFYKNTGDFRSLAKLMGKSLRKFHDIEWDFFDMNPEERIAIGKKTDNFLNEALSHEEGLIYLAQHQDDFDYESMKKYLVEHKDVYKSDVMIHGDFNPRNIFVDSETGELKAVVDVEDTCMGDRHYDIYFAIWTTGFYMGILENPELAAECEKIFIDSYGRDKFDSVRYEYCKKLACMHWQEHNDICGL